MRRFFRQRTKQKTMADQCRLAELIGALQLICRGRQQASVPCTIPY
ncbi:MAG: hypothetical protein E6G71_19445 [Alphaproteobacteria bacterium]|nr:MAG: hypothetical protein E6G71_19445 [Alphaproteobacteria bacterium]